MPSVGEAKSVLRCHFEDEIPSGKDFFSCLPFGHQNHPFFWYPKYLNLMANFFNIFLTAQDIFIKSTGKGRELMKHFRDVAFSQGNAAVGKFGADVELLGERKKFWFWSNRPIGFYFHKISLQTLQKWNQLTLMKQRFSAGDDNVLCRKILNVLFHFIYGEPFHNYGVFPSISSIAPGTGEIAESQAEKLGSFSYPNPLPLDTGEMFGYGQRIFPHPIMIISYTVVCSYSCILHIRK